jgi:putative ABC transport system permease protein
MGPAPVESNLIYGGDGEPGVRVQPLVDSMTAPVRPMMRLLAIACALTLIVSVANSANVSLFRGLSRSRELAIRQAVGAGRVRLVRQLLTETVVLSLAAGVVATVVASILIAARPALIASMPRVDQVRVDAVTLGFAALTSIGVGMLLGVLSAVIALRAAPLIVSVIAPTEPHLNRFVRRGLLIVEAALAVVLLAGALSVGRSVNRLLAKDTGFDVNQVVTARVSLQGRQNQPQLWRQVSGRLLERLRGEPGIHDVGVASMVPLGDSTNTMGFRLDRSSPAIARALGYVVSPGYSEALRLRLKSGRLLAADDEVPGWQPMVVNEQFVNSYLNDGHPPIGRQYRNLLAQDVTTEIVGVVGNVLKDGLLDTPRPELYVLSGNQGLVRIGREINIVVRTDREPRDVAALLRNVMRQIDPNAPVHDVRTLSSQVADTVANERLVSTMVGAFALMAVALAGIGLYGLLSYDAARRRREFGTRAALGATSRHLMLRVGTHSLLLISAGLVIGSATVLALTRSVRHSVPGIENVDLSSLVAAAAVMLAVALAATLIPAWRAGQVQPAVVLRTD